MNGEISPDDVTAAVIEEEEELIDSTTPEKEKQKVCVCFWKIFTDITEKSP